MSTIRAFLFDIGNVLVRFDFMKACRAIAARSAANEREVLERIDPLKFPYEDGRMPRAEFLRQVFELLAYRGSEAEFIAAWQGIFAANEPMVALVRQLHGRFPLYLLSNTNDLHVEVLWREFDYFQLFAGGTFSYAVGAAKPDRRIYEIACERHSLVPAETFFIDDLVENIATACTLGFQTHHYHPDRHGELLSALDL